MLWMSNRLKSLSDLAAPNANTVNTMKDLETRAKNP